MQIERQQELLIIHPQICIMTQKFPMIYINHESHVKHHNDRL